MKKLKCLKGLLIACFLAAPLVMVGCSGDDGATGPQGPPGPGVTTAETCAVCHKSGAIAGVSDVHPGLQTPLMVQGQIDNAQWIVDDVAQTAFLQINFTVTDQNGNYIPSLADANPTNASRLAFLRPAYGQVQAAADGFGDWVSFTTRDADPANLVDNGDGTYVYTSTNNEYASFVATDQTRILIIISGLTQNGVAVEPLDITRDITPANALTRNIVTTAACDACHNKLGSTLSGNPFDVPSFHGGTRYLAETCGVCHDAALGGGEVIYSQLVHRIHASKAFGNFDFTIVKYPQDLRNCTTCHDPNAPDSGIWQNRQNAQTCFNSCHGTEVVQQFMPTAPDHTSVVTNNSACSNCHGVLSTPVLNVSNFHTIFAQAQSAKFQFNIVDTSFDTTTRELSVVYSVTDPTNADAAYVLNGTNVDFAWNQGSNSRLFIDVAFPPAEITNAGSGQDVGQPISLNGLAGTDNGDGTYTVTTAIPAGVTAVTVAMEGHPAAQDPADNSIARIPVTCPTTDVSLDGNPVTSRPAIVDIAKCDKCHFQLSLHGNNRTDNIGLCVLCHNANATDVERRGGIAAADAPDGKKEQAIDFKVMIHGIHQASGITVYGFSGTPNTFDDVTFPGILSDCETCHNPGTFGVPLRDAALATTTDTGADLVDPADNLRTTKTTSVCSSCHTDTAALSHMLSEGGHQGLTEEEIQALQ